MTSPDSKNPGSWTTPNRDWRGQSALVPVKTCYRILDIFLWFVSGVGLVGLPLVYVRGPDLLMGNPLFWYVCVLQVPVFLCALFRGWPFPVRYGVMTLGLFSIAFCTAAVLGITPNWTFEILLLVCSTSLFFGVRWGLAMIIAIICTHIVVAWGWVTGRLPAYMPAPGAPVSPMMDLTSTLVWVRILVVSASLQTALVIMMRYLLSDLSNALQQANSTLQKLAVEQEYRARAEEARLKAELAVREAQKFDALGRLASGVAHDINNALCVIKCWSSFLAEDKQVPQVNEAMVDIRRATENAEQLTHHLLAFSRSDPARKEVVDLAELVSLEGKTLARLLPKDVVVVVDSHVPVHVRFGRGQLQEIVLNLAINARDAMPKGGRLGISVSAVTLDGSTSGLAAGNYARLEVTDTGVGMDAATQARIFEPFFTTKPSNKGTGLGLAMVYGLVSGAGGAIVVASQPGQGACFTIHLPAAKAGEAAVKPKAAAITTLTRCRVLLAEYQPEIRALVERILIREGFPVIAVADGDEALATLGVEGSKFGLLVVDGIMPGRPTIEVIEKALEVDADCRVVIVSDQKQDDLLQRGIEKGRYCLLPKPFDAGQLREAVNDVLRHSQVRAD